ncbi:hypothetical protein MGG_05316 [Pyricularia oryzae 70-15]|uniref:N-acetyltransferase domain-containing protein n=1 Tax=Pyricularia oryzae (strain 70-15 / ATCC MYA-4617 / FGSC 8958) TaxID=242507 RepID=G4N036_PYRO7|nr:uncharacterized protein MGG_05316 [Pyricularia oryzae 70-15]EHA53071.1 hypothetical protein MGG_05316 [Pyricularia oryzae 70-15]
MSSPASDTEKKTPAKQVFKEAKAAKTPDPVASSAKQVLDQVIPDQVPVGDARYEQDIPPFNSRYSMFRHPYAEFWNSPEHQAPDRVSRDQLVQGDMKDGQSPPAFGPGYGPFGHPYYPQPHPYHNYFNFPAMPPPPAWYSHGPGAWHPGNWPPVSGGYPTSREYAPNKNLYGGSGLQHGNHHPEQRMSQQNEPNTVAPEIFENNTVAKTAGLRSGHAGSDSGLSPPLKDVKLDVSVLELARNSQAADHGKLGDPMTPVSMKIDKPSSSLALPDEKTEKYTKEISHDMPTYNQSQVDKVSNYTGLGSSVDIRRPTGYTLDIDHCPEPADQPIASDIRGSIGPPHDLHLSMDGRMFKHAWTDDPALTLSSESYVIETIQAWQSSVQPARNIDFKELTKELANRSDCDFDPVALKFKYALDPGDTSTHPDNPKNMDTKRDQKMNAILKRRIKEDRARVPAVPREVVLQEALEPQFACHMRPATEEDLPSLKEIYDLELTQGFQARDKVKLSPRSYVSLLRMCQDRSLPFIVAVAGAPHDVRNGRTPEVAWQSKEPPKGAVLGFSFLSPYHRGFLNDLDSAGDSSVKLDVMIHPDYRSRFIGTALIDKMLQLICPRYNYMDTCQFVDDSAVSLYRGAHTSLHRFYHVHADVLVAGEHDPNAKRYDNLFQDRFGFEKLFVIRGSHQHKNGMLDLVSYHKQCRPVPGAEASEKAAP